MNELDPVGAFYADDALALGRTVYRDVDWHANRFLETYQALFGVHPDPIGIFRHIVGERYPLVP